MVLGLAAVIVAPAAASDLHGAYLETRTCQVYTGPCFANSEVGLAGKDAIMAWNIETGSHQGVDLAGLKVVLVLTASDTLAHRGVDDPQEVKSLLIVDEKANTQQREALAAFVKEHAGRAGQEVRETISAPIDMSLDLAELKGELSAGDAVKLTTRKVKQGDCICSNEVQFYPPLAKLSNFAAAVTVEGEFTGRGLGTTWSTPDSRSAYLGVFDY
jgi:hypothetical protein